MGRLRAAVLLKILRSLKTHALASRVDCVGSWSQITHNNIAYDLHCFVWAHTILNFNAYSFVGSDQMQP